MSQTINPKQITVAQMAPHIHSFLPNENKVSKISNWLILWIEKSLAAGDIKPYDFLPSKGDLAFHIGVSKGTMQNVFRQVEDAGLIESKQRVGSYIKDKNIKTTVKLTSKREIAVEKIKKYLLENKYEAGDVLISTRKLAVEMGLSNTTIRMAINYLVSVDILEKDENVFRIKQLGFEIKDIEQKTLVKKIAEKIKKYIELNKTNCSKLETNQELAERFDVSVKTIHDAIKILSREGILQTRRGRYGTILLTEENSKVNQYSYEKVELKIRSFMVNNCEIGTKLPSIAEFSNSLKVSPKTIKKALDNLAEDGYIRFLRGRYGGTFVIDLPQDGNDAYKWLAINPQYIQNSEN